MRFNQQLGLSVISNLIHWYTDITDLSTHSTGKNIFSRWISKIMMKNKCCKLSYRVFRALIDIDVQFHGNRESKMIKYSCLLNRNTCLPLYLVYRWVYFGSVLFFFLLLTFGMVQVHLFFILHAEYVCVRLVVFPFAFITRNKLIQ